MESDCGDGIFLFWPVPDTYSFCFALHQTLSTILVKSLSGLVYDMVADNLTCGEGHFYKT